MRSERCIVSVEALLPAKRPVIEALEARQLLAADAATAAFSAHIDFSTPKAGSAPGYLLDAGAAFADRGNGLSYGWNDPRAAKPKARRHAPISPDARHD